MTNKERLLKLYSYLWEYTDEDHPLTLADLSDYFMAMDDGVNRKTIRDDLALIPGVILLPQSRDGGSNRYYLGKRPFFFTEIRLMCDILSSATLLSAHQADDLIEKACRSLSIYERNEIMRQLNLSGHRERGTPFTLEVIPQINDAISQRVKITFQYAMYSMEKKRVPRHEGEWYVISPYALVWDRDRYYLIGHSEKRGGIAVFRADRILNFKVLEEKAEPKPDHFQPSEYTAYLFKMFYGPRLEVTMKCKAEMMDTVVDHFGLEAETTPTEDGRFLLKVMVDVSPAFFSWVFQFGKAIQILSPESVREDYRRHLLENLNQYEGNAD